MGERSEYTPGIFCWADLPTSDQPASKTFYSALFGWEAEDLPVGDGVSYSMMRLEGAAVAAISPQNAQQREQGLPPVWNSYVSVSSADETAARAAELGATVHAPPFAVMEAGRMAVIQDPQGAFFMLWQPGQHHGAGLVNAHGALAWNELNTPDLAASQTFYESLFGWQIASAELGPEPYLLIKNGESNNGGIRGLNAPDMPPHWAVYFGIDDLDQGLAKLAELGGAVHAGPIDIGIARIAVVADPQGAPFALYSGQLEP